MFSSRLLLNLGLFLGIIVLALVAYSISQEPEKSSVFSQLSISDITEIKIEHQSKIITLEKDNKNWLITQPIKIEADEFRIQSILNILPSGTDKFYTVDKTDLKKYSLDPPAATLQLNKQLFLFGTTSAIEQKRYILTNNKLFLIDDTFLPLITSGYKNLMRRQLFPVDTNISEVRINEQRIYKNENGSWISETNNFSSDDLKRYIDNWQHIQAYAVSSASPPYSGNRVVIKTSNGEFTFMLQKTEHNTQVTNPALGLSYQFDISAFDSLSDVSRFSQNETLDDNQPLPE